MMKAGAGWLKQYGGKALNIALIILILLLIFVPDTKSWMMRQFMRTGIFNARVDKQQVASSRNINILGLTFTDMAGASFSTQSFEGKIVVINFWATWCPPCRAEMPSLNKLFKEFENDKDMAFLLVTEDEEPLKARDYLRNHNYHLPLYTASGAPGPGFYSGTLPTTLVFDKRGNLIYRHEGMANYHSENFVAALRALK